MDFEFMGVTDEELENAEETEIEELENAEETEIEETENIGE